MGLTALLDKGNILKSVNLKTGQQKLLKIKEKKKREKTRQGFSDL